MLKQLYEIVTRPSSQFNHSLNGILVQSTHFYSELLFKFIKMHLILGQQHLMKSLWKIWITHWLFCFKLTQTVCLTFLFVSVLSHTFENTRWLLCDKGLCCKHIMEGSSYLQKNTQRHMFSSFILISKEKDNRTQLVFILFQYKKDTMKHFTTNNCTLSHIVMNRPIRSY